MQTPDTFISVNLAPGHALLFHHQDGMHFLEALSQAVSTSRYSTEAPSYSIQFLTRKDLRQEQIDRLLGLGDPE